MLAMRIITQSESDCYAVLGIIHNQWRPVPDASRTSSPSPQQFLQVAAHHLISERATPSKCRSAPRTCTRWRGGIAAHWKYKDGPVSARDEQRLAWLRQVVEWQRDIKNSKEFLATLKIDLYPRRSTPSHPKAAS